MFGASFSQDVLKVQQLLNKLGYKLVEDGLFGNNTSNAIKDYQTKNNLAIDGLVSTALINRLTLAPVPKTSSSFMTKIKDTYTNSPKTFYIVSGSAVFLIGGILFLKSKIKKKS